MRWMKRLLRPVTVLLAVSTASYAPLSLSLSAAPLASQNGDGVPLDGEIAPGQLLEVQATVFEKLFNQPYNPEEWTYPLDKEVEGNGKYTGTNYLEQKFTLDVVANVAVDIKTLDGITDKEREWAVDNGFAYRGVIATLSTELGSFPVIGLACYQDNALGTDSRFILVNTVDGNNALFAPTPALGALTIELSCGWWPIPIPIFCLDPDCVEDCFDDFEDCVSDAEDDFDQAVDAATNAYNSAVTTATANRDAAISAAHTTFNGTKSALDNILAVELIGCTAALTAAHIGCAFVTALFWWTGGAATLACVLAAQAVYAACVATAMFVYNNNLRAAEITRDAAIALANANYATAVAAAEAALQQALADALQDFQQALDECVEALEDCLDDCPLVICGWRIIWICLPF